MSIVKDMLVLRQKSEEIYDVNEIRDILKRLEEELDKTPNGVGLAAIQIGIPKKVGIIKAEKKTTVLINPVVIEMEDPIVYPNEGCLSFPGTYRDTNRFQHITLKNQVIDGDKLREETAYFYYSPDPEEVMYGSRPLTTIAIQHEIDHFNGGLIVDHIVENKPIHKDKKVGRNDPCPCGSGKKYKKCCIDKS